MTRADIIYPRVDDRELIATVVILTKNPGLIFREVFVSVLEQEAPFKFEILIVDSGSTDGTIEYVLSRPEVRLVQIPPSEFGHGRTRNLAMSLANGSYVAMLTHDAKPASRKWLANLIAPMEENSNVAGVFGRHLAYPSANAYTKRDLKLHFDGFLAWPRAFHLDDRPRYKMDPGYRQVLHYFSDNNAGLRKLVWARIPYPDVDFAEDQLWAKAVVEQGYLKAYADDAAVFHSHDYSILDSFRRSFDESRAMSRLFGYVLCPSVSSGLAQVLACSKRDISYLRDNGGLLSQLGLMLRTPALHFARQIGFLLGRYQGPMRAIVFRLFSLDDSIKRRKAKNSAEPANSQLMDYSGSVLDLGRLMVVDKDEFISRVFYGIFNRSTSDSEIADCLEMLKPGRMRLDLLWKYLNTEGASSTYTSQQLKLRLTGFDTVQIEDKFFLESAAILCGRAGGDLGWLREFLTTSHIDFITYGHMALYGSLPPDNVVATLQEKFDHGSSRLQVLVDMLALKSARLIKSAPWGSLLHLFSEDHSNFLVSAYKLALGRIPDPTGQSIYKKQCTSVTSKVQLFFELVTSVEGRAISEESGHVELGHLMAEKDDVFIRRLFLGILNRGITDAELANHTSALRLGTLRLDLLLRLLSSVEGELLGAPQSAAQGIQQQLANFGSLHIDDKFFVEAALRLCSRGNRNSNWLANYLTASPQKFLTLCVNALDGSPLEESVAANLCKKLSLGRPRYEVLNAALTSGKSKPSHAPSLLQQGLSWESILRLLSLEDADFLDTAYKCVLGRNIDPTGAKEYRKHLASGISKPQIFFELLTSPEAQAASTKVPRVENIVTRDLAGVLYPRGQPGPVGKIDVLTFFDFVLTKPVLPIYASPYHEAIQRKTVNWIIPDFGIGSGGHLNIFRHIFLLEKRGYQNNICIVGTNRHNSVQAARALIRAHFFPISADVFFGIENLPAAFYTFATGWTTAYYLNGFGKTAIKLYFIQDFEPLFFTTGSEYDFAERTYKLGFVGVCAGNWLAEIVSKNYSMKSHSIGFSYDRKIYVRSPRREPNVRRVFCYFRPPTVRRGLETALLALNLVGRELPHVKFIFAGWDMSSYHFPHETLNAGLLAINELPDLYSQCDVALVLSFTNLSLLPLELMACGCPVVSNRGKNTEWLLNDDNSILTDSDPYEIAKQLIRVITDDELRLTLSQRAMEFARSTSWERENESMVTFLENLAP